MVGVANFTASNKDGQIVDAQRLWPTAWLEQHGVAAGTMLPLNIPELQVKGAAFVESVEPCPPIASGDGIRARPLAA